MPVHKEVKEPVLEVVPTITETGKAATENANAEIDQLKTEAQVQQFNLASVEFQKSENKTVAAFGKAAEGFVKDENFDDAQLALSMAEMLTQTNELKPEYTKEWKPELEEYTEELAKQMKEELNDEIRKGAYLTMSIVFSNISDAARMEKLDYFVKKAESPKYKESTKKFVLDAVEGATKLYSEGKLEQGDKVLAYLSFYTDTVLKKGIKSKEGRGAVESAIKLALKEDEKAEKLFQKGLKKYGVTLALKQLWKSYAKLESNYLMVSDSIGENKKVAKTLKETKALLDARDADGAYAKLKTLTGEVNGMIEMATVVAQTKEAGGLDSIENDLKATPEIMEKYEEGLKPYAKEFPEQTKKLVGKLEDVSNDSKELLEDLKYIKEQFPTEKEKAKFQDDVNEFSEKRTEVIGTVSTSTLIMGNIMSQKQFDKVLKMGNVDYVRKDGAMNQGKKAIEHYEKSLDLVIEEGPKSKKAKEQYEQAVYAKTGALALLDLEQLSYEEEEKKFAFFQEGSMKVYDACTDAKATQDVWKLNETLHNMESSVLASDDKLFATKEADLQQDIIGDSKIVANHYIAKMEGESALVLDKSTVSKYEATIASNSATLGKKIENAEKINMAVKLAASFIHPSIFLATTIEMACKEYEVTETMSWSTGLMLAASVLALRQMAVFKGLGVVWKEATVGMKIAKVAITGTELGIGGYLMTHGAIEGYNAIKAGNISDGALTLSTFAVPLLFAAARKPMMTYMGKKVPAFRQFTGEFVTEAAISKQNKKFGLADAKTLWNKGVAKVKAMKEIPEVVKLKIKGAPVALVPAPMMFLPAIVKISKVLKKPVPELLKKATTGDRQKYAKSVGGKEGKNFFDTVKKNREIVESELASVREEIMHKDKSEIYKALQGESADAEKILKEFFPEIEPGKMEKKATFGFLMLDKGKTWELNNIHKSFGDAGLLVFFKAEKNLLPVLEKKYNVKLKVKFSEKGDELLFKFTGEKVTEAMKEFENLYAKEMSKIAEDMGFSGPLKDAITDFSATHIETTATMKEGKISFSAEIKGETKTMGLEALLATSEAAEKLTAMEKMGINVDPLWKFLELPEIELPAAAKEIKDITKYPEKTIDQVISFRANFEPATKEAMWKMTDAAGKGVAHVDNGVVGPSVLNHLGHPVTDVFTMKYHLEFAKQLKAAGIKVETYAHGPMSIAIVGKVSPKKIKKVIAKTNKALAKDPDLAGLGVTTVEAFTGKNKDMANYDIAESVMGYKVSNKSYEQMKNLVTLLHMEPKEIVKMLEEKNIPPETIKLVKNIKEKNIKWVRNPEDLVHYLRMHTGDKEIMGMFNALGIKIGKKIKAPKKPPPVTPKAPPVEMATAEKPPAAKPKPKLKAKKKPVEIKPPAKKPPLKKAKPAKKKFQKSEELSLKAEEATVIPKVKAAPEVKISDGVLLQADNPAQVHELTGEFIKLSSKERTAVIEYARGKGVMMQSATALLQDLNFILEQGDKIAKLYGVEKADMIKIYTEAISAEDATQMISSGNSFHNVARNDLRKLLGIEIESVMVLNEKHEMHGLASLDHDNALWSILTDGELLAQSGEKLGGKITNVKYEVGILGAYRITVKGKKGEGAFYLKKIDQSPAKLGSEVFKLSGNGAPEVVLTGKYFDVKRNVSESYGVLSNILGEGEMILAGEVVKFKVHEGSSLEKLWPNINPKNKEPIKGMQEYFGKKENVVDAKEACGEFFGSVWGTGTKDMHDGNVWFSKMEITNENAAKVAKHLEKNGYKVKKEGDKYFMYKFEGIDLDGTSSFPMMLTAEGKPKFDMNNYASVSTLKYIILQFYKIENKGKIPTTPELTSYTADFLASGSPFAKGVLKWVKEHQNNPEYVKAMHELLGSYEGTIGIGTPKAGEAFSGPLLGEHGLFKSDDLHRLEFTSSAERIISQKAITAGTELEGVGTAIEKTKTKSGFLISENALKKTPGGDKLAKIEGAVELTYGGEKHVLLPTEALPESILADKTLRNTFNELNGKHDVLKISKKGENISTFDLQVKKLDSVMPNQDTPYYLVPVKEGQAFDPAKTINLGFIESKKFQVYEKPPEGVTAIEVKRRGESIVAETGSGEKLGVESMETGAIPCFDALMEMSPEAWQSEIVTPVSNFLVNHEIPVNGFNFF